MHNFLAVFCLLRKQFVNQFVKPNSYSEEKNRIRIENLVAAKNLESNQFGDFMDFETLTVCYIDTDLVEKSILHT